MTVIATLPAGRYALMGACKAWVARERGDPVPGVGPQDHVYITNHDEVAARARKAVHHPVPSSDGPFDSASGPAARVTLHGVEAHYDHADDIMMPVQTPSGTLYCMRVMVVVSAPTMEHDRVSGTMWRIVESDAPIVVSYADCVLSVGDQTIDLAAPQFFQAGMSDAIRPGDDVYEMLGCADLPKHNGISRLRITQTMLDGLAAIGTPVALQALERAMHFGIGGDLDLMPASITAPADDAPLHLTSWGEDWVIRKGSPVYELLAPQHNSSNQMMVENADKAMVERLTAIGGEDADNAVKVITGFFRAKTGGRAYFSTWRDPLPIAA